MILPLIRREPLKRLGVIEANEEYRLPAIICLAECEMMGICNGLALNPCRCRPGPLRRRTVMLSDDLAVWVYKVHKDGVIFFRCFLGKAFPIQG